jgi:hypothetical protein
MEPEQIIESNKLIAEFMGGKKMWFIDETSSKRWTRGAMISETKFAHVPENNEYYSTGRAKTNHPFLQHHQWKFPNSNRGYFDVWLKYDREWNWLIPVVVKCREIYNITSGVGDYQKILGDLYREILCSLESLDIESLYLSVVDFIQWINGKVAASS